MGKSKSREKPRYQSTLRISWGLAPSDWPSGGGGYSWEFLLGVCHPVLLIPTLFQTKKCHFPEPFSDQTSKIHTRFQTWPLGRNCVFLFLSSSFGIETINTFIHSRSSLENYTRLQTKMGKVYTRFQTKTAQKPDPMGWYIPI